MSPGGRRAVLVLAFAIFLALSWIGVTGGLQQLSEAHAIGQKIQTFAQLGYGILGLVAVATTFWARRVRRAIGALWLVCLGVAAGFAPVAWGGSTLGAGALAGVAGLVIGLGVLWLLQVGSRVQHTSC